MLKIKNWLVDNSLYIAWAVSLVSMVGSLYFSEVLGIVPCILCWYQRIAMYPIVVILGIGILGKDKKVSSYVLPFGFIGTLIALYQNLLVWHVLSETLAPCVAGVSCIEQKFVVMNFITIPFMSLISFVLITVLMLIHRMAHKNV